MTRINEYLEIVSSKVQCMKCKHAFGSESSKWKLSARVREVQLNRAGPLMSDTKDFILREFYCPGCATLLEVEMTRRGEPFIIDEIEQ